MKIGLLNLEPQYKNLAIEKLRIFYSQQGHEVEDYFALSHYDNVFASSIFTFTPKHNIPQGAVCGGTGFDLTTALPPEIDTIKPYLNFGFTTRGCIRKCPFCVVPEKEGKVRIEGDLYDLWDRKGKLITLYDNNILALPEHFYRICQQSLDRKLKLDFNQGLDFRLLTPEIVKLLKDISHKEYHFAFDHPSYLEGIDRAIKLLQKGGINRCNWYVLVGFNTTFQEDLDRLNFLRSKEQRAFVQRYITCRGNAHYQALADWANQHNFFAVKSFGEFLCMRKDRVKVLKQLKDLGNRVL